MQASAEWRHEARRPRRVGGWLWTTGRFSSRYVCQTVWFLLPLIWFSLRVRDVSLLAQWQEARVRRTPRTQASTCLWPSFTERVVRLRPLLSLVQARCYLILTTALRCYYCHLHPPEEQTEAWSRCLRFYISRMAGVEFGFMWLELS